MDKDAAPLNHPALAKISDQPSFISANFSPFTSTEALRSSGISPVQSLNLKPNPRGGAAKKITSLPYKKFVYTAQKKKIKQATKSKTSRLASDVLLGPSKRRKRRVCRDQTQHDTPSDSDTDLAVLFADDSTEEDEEQDADFCSLLVVSLKTTMEKTRYDVRNVLFLVCILCICIFFVFCNYSLCFLCKLFTCPY